MSENFLGDQSPENNLRSAEMTAFLAKPRIVTGRLIAASFMQTELIGAFPQAPSVGSGPLTPDRNYAVVNSLWLDGFYKRWEGHLFSKGVTGWDTRFDCNKFASSYAAEAQIEFYAATWHSWQPGQALAVGEIWYTRDQGGDHAINLVYTEQGPLFIDPQDNSRKRLTNAELGSIFYKRF